MEIFGSTIFYSHYLQLITFTVLAEGNLKGYVLIRLQAITMYYTCLPKSICSISCLCSLHSVTQGFFTYGEPIPKSYHNLINIIGEESFCPKPGYICDTMYFVFLWYFRLSEAKVFLKLDKTR